MKILVDTGAAMNTGNLNYYLWAMSQCPEMIAEYLQYGECTKYRIVQHCAASDLNIKFKSSTHSQMTAVIRYHKIVL